MFSDLEIAQRAKLLNIREIANKLDIQEEDLKSYGPYKAKVSLRSSHFNKEEKGKLILVTAMSPTPAGEGKTTASIGLGDALSHLGKKTSICLREPSLGPVFGIKGGAAGGGMSQVVPMEDINLHFTGDFNAIQLANNLLAAMIDNHIHHGNSLEIDTRRITWKRVLDMNDRALRSIHVGLGGTSNGFTREDSFDIVVASEVMAIFCLAKSWHDLKLRLGKIVVAYTRKMKAITCKDLKAEGAMTALLKTAFEPNLVQTLEHTPTFIHGGPFANIAHGCSSVIATKLALKVSDYVVTEAGFGADLGAEKFINIKCRKADLHPSAAVVVASLRALKFHGGVPLQDLSKMNTSAVKEGAINLKRHLHNIKEHYGLPCVVALNTFTNDTKEEIHTLKKELESSHISIIKSEHWAQGSKGAVELAEHVIELCNKDRTPQRFVYEQKATLWDKTRTIAEKIYGASKIIASKKVTKEIDRLQEAGYGLFPICIAKTQYSFSTDPSQKGAPVGHTLEIREVRLSAGAEFIVMVCGDVMTMPGLPKEPAAHKISVDKDGKIVGLF